MDTGQILSIVAIVLGPILAVQAQRIVDRLRAQRDRRMVIFKTLMATRATALIAEHVQALNSIDIEFPERGRWKPVSRAWKVYFAHLEIQTEPNTDEDRRWQEKRVELLGALLLAMGQSLGYDFDEVKIKRGIYRPRGHVQLEQDQELARRLLLAIMNGERAIPVSIVGAQQVEPVVSARVLSSILCKFLKDGEVADSQRRVLPRLFDLQRHEAQQGVC